MASDVEMPPDADELREDLIVDIIQLLSEKEGMMGFSNPINIATATMEQIYKRLAGLGYTPH